MNDQRLAEELQKVAAAFDARLPERLQLLAVLWQAWEECRPGSSQPLLREMHRLRGTAASYGYRLLSQRLREAEDLLRQETQEAQPALRALMRQIFAQRWERDTPLA